MRTEAEHSKFFARGMTTDLESGVYTCIFIIVHMYTFNVKECIASLILDTATRRLRSVS